MRCLIATVGLFLLGVAGPVLAQHRLLEVMNWKFHGPIESIEQREYKFDYYTLNISKDFENSAVYHFDDAGRLKTIDEQDPYGKTTYTLRYDDAGRLEALHRFRKANGGKTFENRRSCQRNEKGEITSLAVEEIVGIVSIKLKRQVENESEGNRRMIKTYEPKEDGGRAERLYLFEDDQLLSILKYDGYSKPDRISEANRYNAKGLREAELNYHLADQPEKITSRYLYKYEFDARGNWISQTRHTKWRDDPNKAMIRITRVVKYRDQ